MHLNHVHSFHSSNISLPLLGPFKKYLQNPIIAVHMCIDVGPPTGGVEGESVASLFKTSQGPPDYTVPGLSCLS